MAAAHDDDFGDSGFFGFESGAGADDLLGLAEEGNEVAVFNVILAGGDDEAVAAVDGADADAFGQFDFG